MAESVAVIMSSLERMDAWKILAIGVVGYLLLKTLAHIVVGIIAFPFIPWGWKTRLRKVRELKRGVAWEDDGKGIPVSARVLGLGILFLSLGAGVMLTLIIPITSGWAIFGTLLLTFGVGLIIYYVVASRAESPQRPDAGEREDTGR